MGSRSLAVIGTLSELPGRNESERFSQRAVLPTEDREEVTAAVHFTQSATPPAAASAAGPAGGRGIAGRESSCNDSFFDQLTRACKTPPLGL